MIHGFKGKCMTTVEEWLVDYSLKTGHVVDINPDLISMPIKFDGKEVDAFILDIIDNKLVIQLALPIKEKFDNKSNRYETSYVRKLINSNVFLNRFNQEFVKCIQPTEIHTEDYVTNDKLWLLSHEEINCCSDYLRLRPNHECHAFEMFKTIDLAAYSHMLFKNEIDVIYGWRLRSAYYSTSYHRTNSRYVGVVYNSGKVDYSYAGNTYSGAVLPVCIIC